MWTRHSLVILWLILASWGATTPALAQSSRSLRSRVDVEQQQQPSELSAQQQQRQLKKNKDKSEAETDTVAQAVAEDLPVIEDHYFEDEDLTDVGEETDAAPPAADMLTKKKEPPANISGDLRTLDNIMFNFQAAKERMLKRLKEEYGEEIFNTVWLDEPHFPMPNNSTTCTMGRNAFQKGSKKASLSWKRMVRKMKINLLQYLLSGEVQDFVWATAGNSDAAGHGNFFGEQYTMVMADRAKDLFNSVGLDMVARPFGIGGATSAPEIAGCAKEIFGTDVDLITWDFAMTDGRWYWRMEMFAHRVMMLPNNPVLLVLQPGTEPKRIDVVEHLTQQGMGVLRQEEKYVIDRQLQFPDSRYRSDNELAAMPEHVRWFKCGYGIEMGPGCHDHKFTQNGTCDERSSRTNWHHGWKWHAFHGNLYALFLMEIMEDALFDLSFSQGSFREELDRMEAKEYENMIKFQDEAQIKYHHAWTLDDVDAMQLMRDHTYCHTALLPAQTRYLGHVFNKEMNGGWFSYNKGTQMKFAEQDKKSKMPLSYIPRDRTDKCEAPLNIDSKDFFLASHAYHGYQRVVIPNDLEIKAYGDNLVSGIIMVCASACSFECKGSPLLSPDSIHKGNKSNFRVNGQNVTGVVRMDNCFLLQQEGGSLYWRSNSEGRYEIEVHTLAKGKQFRFTSFIVW